MGHHLAVDNDAGFVNVQKKDELETGVTAHEDTNHDDQPSFGEELWVVVDCFATTNFDVDVFVKVFVLLTGFQRV